MKRLAALMAFLCVGTICWGYWQHQNLWFNKNSEFSATQPRSQELPLIQALAQVVHKDSQNLWPEYSIKDHPIIVTFDSGQAYAFNFKASDASWSKHTLHGQTVFVNSSNHWGLNEIQVHYNFPIEDQLAFVYHVDLPDDASLVEPLRLLLCEYFRAHQGERFEKDVPDKCYFFNGLHILNVTWMQIEEMILADFMNAQLDIERSNTHKASHLRDFLAVYRCRQQFMTDETLAWESDQQRQAGISNYTALKCVENRLELKIAEYLRTALQASAIDDEILERTTKGRHCIVGASLGYVLDFLEIPNWQARLQSDKITLIDILAEELDLDDDEVERRITKIKSRYAFNQVQHQVTTAIEIYYEETAELMREYAEMDGVEVALKCDLCAQSNFESSACKYYSKEGSEVSLIDNTLVQDSDERFSFKTLSIPAIVKKNNGDIVFKLENTAHLVLDGLPFLVTSLLDEGGSRIFNTLSLQAQHCELHSADLPGCIRTLNGCIEVSYASVKSGADD
jgi:hypothetical protein